MSEFDGMVQKEFLRLCELYNKIEDQFEGMDSKRADFKFCSLGVIPDGYSEGQMGISDGFQAGAALMYDQLKSQLEEKDKTFPIQTSRSYKKPHPTKIPWDLAELAYSVYSARYGTSQSLQTLADRGGFGPQEMDDFVPDWIAQTDFTNKLKQEIQDLREKLQRM